MTYDRLRSWQHGPNYWAIFRRQLYYPWNSDRYSRMLLRGPIWKADA